MGKNDLENLIDTIKKKGSLNSTEIGEVFGNLDRDELSDENLSDIDFNTRLKSWEISNCIIFDEFKQLGILPHWANLTRILKRLNISRDGKGRGEKVQIASASREAEMEGRKGIFGFRGGDK